MKKRLILLPLILLLLIISCKSDPEGYFESSNLPGMIYDDDNRPCDKVLLTVWSIDEELVEEEILKVQSDINGRFTIPGLNKGNFRILAEKEGYESITSEIFYSSRLDVLYLKILSQKQILSKATDALSERRFGKVEEFLLRSEKINSDDPYSLYLKSVFLYEKKQYNEAVIPLERIISLGYKFPYVHLLLADLFQYELDEQGEALFQLNKYLDLFEDSEIELRKKELEKFEI